MEKFTPIWYTIPLFLQSIPAVVYHKEQEQAQIHSMEIRNLHVLARTDYFAEQGCECKIRISADDYYKLYINGVFVAQGPSPGYPEHYFYNEINITDYLEDGRNVIAVHLYYQGLINRVWNSGDNRFGVGTQIKSLSKKDWENVHWRYCISDAYSGDIIGYDTQFLENFDSRLWEDDWNQKDFDDSAWEEMVPAPWADYHFEQEPVRTLQVYQKTPKEILQREDGAWFVDMGSEVTGSLCIKARGREGSSVVIHCGEELDEMGDVRYHMRCGCTYEEIWTLKRGIHVLEPYDYKAFRYAQLLPGEGAELLEVYGLVRHYPFEEESVSLKCSDPRIEQIFELCKNTIKYGTQEGYLDCPSREKGQYLGDAVISAHAHAWLSGDTRLLRKCIRQFAWSSCICPGIMGVAPGSLMQEIADFSLLWPQLLWMDYQFTGDKEFLREYYPTAKQMLAHFSRYAREDGLLEQVGDKWNLVDWPENLRDDYDFCLSRPVVARGCHNVINALYVGAIKLLGDMERLLTLPVTKDFEPLREAYIRAFYRKEQKLFADSEKSSHCSLHSNAYALYFGLQPEEAEKNIGDFLVKKGFCCGVLMSYFVMKGLAGRGRYEDVYQLLVNESEHGWMNMIREGATTCFEAWGKNQKWNTSFCHPWACAPAIIIIEDLAGITLKPGTEKGYEVQSHIPEGIREFSLKVPFKGASIQTTQRV
ncbi:MAG: family 78 glycoside hydrolase catalytic domain [Eubacteriales bacterium]|nr:family 78 glycoside hydrolase catalytic domain [Eubacteriales bacterium]